MLDALAARAREAWPHLSASSRMFYAADIEFTPSPTPSTLAALMSSPTHNSPHPGPAGGGGGAGAGGLGSPRAGGEVGGGGGVGVGAAEAAAAAAAAHGAVLAGQMVGQVSAAAADSAKAAVALQEVREGGRELELEWSAVLSSEGEASGEGQ